MNMRQVWLGNSTHGGRCDTSSVSKFSWSFERTQCQQCQEVSRCGATTLEPGEEAVHLLLTHWLRCRYSAGMPNLPVATRGIEKKKKKKNHMGPKRQDIQDAKLLTTCDGPVLWGGLEELPGMRSAAGYANLQFDPTCSTRDITALHLGANTSTVFSPEAAANFTSCSCHISEQSEEHLLLHRPHPQQQ